VGTGWSGWSGTQPDGRCLPLLIFPCTIKSRSPLLAPAHPGGHRKRAVKCCVCVCVCVCLVAIVQTKPVIAILVPKLVAMATSLSNSGPPANTRFLGPIRAYNLNSISIGPAVFAQITIECSYTLQWDVLFPSLQNCPFHGGSGPHLKHGSLSPPESST